MSRSHYELGDEIIRDFRQSSDTVEEYMARDSILGFEAFPMETNRTILISSNNEVVLALYRAADGISLTYKDD